MALPATIPMPARPASTTPSIVLRPQCRQIEAQVLAALRSFHQRAATCAGPEWALLRNRATPVRRRVGAPDILDRNDMARDHHRGLTDVEWAERQQQLAPFGDIGQCLGGIQVPSV